MGGNDERKWVTKVMNFEKKEIYSKEMEYFIDILIEKFSDHIYDGEEDCDIEEREKVLIGE